jgi:predicted tellurium resistance membrane protein TerC
MEALLAILSDPQLWIAFFTLTALELVLGIDNIIFISILVDRLGRANAKRPAASACSSRCSCASGCCWDCRGSWA